MKDADGFELVTCSCCGETKLATLFAPSSLVGRAARRCMKCKRTRNKRELRNAAAPPSKETWGAVSKIVRHGEVEGLFE
jgi:hypothetical protein